MIINNVELEDLDILEAGVAERYEKVLERVVEAAKKTEGLKMAESIRKQCEAVFMCFNEIFGEGTDKKVFGERVNLLICMKAFEELVEKANEQKSELDKLLNKYSPNRAQKRGKK